MNEKGEFSLVAGAADGNEGDLATNGDPADDDVAERGEVTLVSAEVSAASPPFFFWRVTTLNVSYSAPPTPPRPLCLSYGFGGSPSTGGATDASASTAMSDRLASISSSRQSLPNSWRSRAPLPSSSKRWNAA